jgi:hypothetical protein
MSAMMMRYAKRLGMIALLMSATIVAVAEDEPVAPPEAAGFRIERVSVVLRDEVYYLNAGIHFLPGAPVIEAMERGVPLPVILEVEILRERSYLWNETVTDLEQRYEVDHHELTRQYTVRNLNIDTQSAYPTREAALSALGRIVDLPLIDANLLDPAASYIGRMRASIDTDALPVPLRLRALVSSEWRLSSGWHEWRF